MKLSRLALPLVAATCLFMAGCASHHPYYYAPAPPPPPPGYNGAPPLIERAQHEGYRAGTADGARDAYNGFGYHPQHDRNFHNTPGYDPAMGPYKPYRDAFRGAYLQGYDQGFHRR
jgi:ribosome modulation factor